MAGAQDKNELDPNAPALLRLQSVISLTDLA